LEQKIVRTRQESHGTYALPPYAKLRIWMQIAVSAILLLAGIGVLASPNPIFPHQIDEGSKKFAAGWIGAVIGYWFS
jgi:hypothetical protein